MVSVHRAQLCTSPLGVVPAGLGDGVGDCHDVANLPKECLFISPLYLLWRINLTLFFRVWIHILNIAEYASSYVGAHPMLP